jgi:hypothetical protein
MNNHSLFYLLPLLLLFAIGCNKDDDNGDGIGGDPNTLEITLSWEQIGADIDLYMTNHPDGADDGALVSEDDLEGPGVEFIRWVDNAPDGSYTVLIEHFDSDRPVDYVLTISSAESSREFSGTVTEDEDEDFISFVKAGTELEF